MLGDLLSLEREAGRYYLLIWPEQAQLEMAENENNVLTAQLER